MRFGSSQCADDRSLAGGPSRKPRQRARDPARRSYLGREQRGLGSKSGRRAANRRIAGINGAATFFEKAIEHLQIALTLEPWTARPHRQQNGGILHPLPSF